MDAEQRERLEKTTRWDPAEAEERIFARWQERGYFSPEPEGTAEENFSIAIPPPNVTGSLHMGHGLNNTIQDTLVRKRRMEGRRVKWILGTDHAGIATQSVVEKELRKEGIDRRELGRDAFVARVWEWREQYGGTIIQQLKRLGASGDFANERFTLDDGYVRAVYRVFVALYEKGLIYRDHYMVNWDPGSHSAISDLEVENRDVTDTLYSIDYPVEGSDKVLTVATVRPETMLADTAVAVHPDDERYAGLVGAHCVLPLAGRKLPIIADPYVDPEFGTGALKITPGHDPNDFEIGRRHGLEEISVIGEDGRMNQHAGERYAGLTAAEAQERVVADLRAESRISGEEDYAHAVPFSHRSGQRIEPLISLQWFCRMEELAKPAIDVVKDGSVTFTPERWGRVYLDWMENIRPWCVSRQLWWGHQLPVWYCDACGKTIVAESDPGRCPDCGGELRRDPDVLDTWFSSALWPFATLGWPDDTAELRAFYPTDVLVTARDIIYLWVARMIMTGLEFPGEIPFSDVYITSVVQAPDGRRMSKSLGTGIDPLEVIDSQGADALRFGLLTMSSSQDVRYSEAKIQQGRDLANKLWNASRLILMNAGDAAPGPSGEAVASSTHVEDAWILSRLERTVELVGERIDAYDFSHAALELYRFTFSELCDWYLEIVKPRLYDGDEAAAGNLLHVLERTLALAHPMMPFVTEEIWSYLPDREAELIVSPFPVAERGRFDAAAEAEVGEAIELTRALRRWRELAGVSPGAVLSARPGAGAAVPHPLVGRLARIAVDGKGEEEAIASVGGLDILPSEGLDAAAVEERMSERRRTLESEVARAEGRLANEGFVANAPEAVVASEREKLERYRAELAELDA